MRRSTFTEKPVSYGAIGGTLSPDLMFFPPQGYRPAEYSTRLGSGAARFAAASASLMTWGVQRGSGVRVADTNKGTGSQYHGLLFHPNGKPLAGQSAVHSEERFAPDGTPFITPGMTAVLKYPSGLSTVKAPVRVVFTIDEPDRVGFAYGTLPRHPASGEELFVVEHREDDTVWMVFRSFSRPNGAWRKLSAPRWRARQRRYAKRYLRVLHPASGQS